MTLRLTGPHVQATGYRQGRDRKLWPQNGITFLVVHTGEGATDEISLLNYLRDLGTASCSCSIGQDGGYATGVRYRDTPWTNPPCHDDTETVELCGFAAWTRDQWLAQPRMLRTLEAWLAWRSAVNKIPLRLVSGDKIRNGVKGICDHAAINDVFHQSSHWDVGASLPWDVVLPNARALRYGDKAPATTPAPAQATASAAAKPSTPATPTPDETGVLDMDEKTLRTIIREEVRAELNAKVYPDRDQPDLKRSIAGTLQDVDASIRGNTGTGAKGS